jgi:rSAM/selenodomain-associated transferase 2
VLRPAASAAPAISVVIPTLDEQASVARALGSTQLLGVERVVVDGGSSDGTLDTARLLRAEKILRSHPGRAQQMNLGFREASGAVIVFLHADTRLEPGWLEALREALRDAGVAGGAFRLRFESRRWRYRLLERGVALRCALLGLPYGDQGLFVRRAVLEAVGGVPQTPIFEDLDLVRVIRRRGRLVCLPLAAWTSARRYERNGTARQVGRNLLALAAYLLGIERERVARWYRRSPGR